MVDDGSKRTLKAIRSEYVATISIDGDDDSEDDEEDDDDSV